MDDTVVSIGEVWDIFRDYGIILLAGKAGLNRPVSSISVLELSSEQQNPKWYLGGELVLSTMQMYPSVKSVVEAVNMLSDRNIAALGIHQGTAPSAPDSQIIDAAEERGLPLFSIPHTMPYSIIFTGVYERIFSKRVTNIIKSEEINTALTQALFARDSVDAISQTLASLVQKTTAILDYDNSLLAATPINDNGKLFIEKIRSGTVEFANSGIRRYDIPSGTDPFTKVPIRIGSNDYEMVLLKVISIGRIIGSIALLAEKEQTAQSAQIDMLGLTHSATAFSIVQMKRRAVLDAEEKMRGDLYSDLLSGTVESEEYIAVRAKQVDIPLNGRHCVIEVTADVELSNHNDSTFSGFGAHLQNLIREACGQCISKSAILPQAKGHLIVLHFLPKTKSDIVEAKIRDIYKVLQEQMLNLPDIHELFVGVGEPQEFLMQLARSCSQAKRATALGRKINESGGLFFFGKMGIYSLVDAKSMDEFFSNCSFEIEQFKQKCGDVSEIYLSTLEAYFDFGESPTATAKALGVHLNTVRYRLKKIGETLGAGFFDDGKEKMRMYLLIKMQKMI